MRSFNATAAVRDLSTLFQIGTLSSLSDSQLLERFVSRRDQAASSVIVQRHGPMVLSLFRRALADPQDAEDAFQATFLVLVGKAKSLRVHDSLGRRLSSVSKNVAAKARAIWLRSSAQRSPM